MKSIISVENISKKYCIAGDRPPCNTLRDLLFDFPGRFMGKSDFKKDFWALKNITFEVNAGDRVGIIGCNGAGKSTLLKLISRVTQPTSGKITLRGQVSSLLEVGTGFHPELTGRENVFLNAAILGIPRSLVRKKFDEIIDFAGVEDFINTPVKWYSSGMGARLGFSIASHFVKDVLIVDEVLAVGDIEFQRKCIKKMQSLSRDKNKTVIFVSHNVALLKKMCEVGVYLDRGVMRFAGDISKACDMYYSSNGKFEDLSVLRKHDSVDIVKIEANNEVASGDDWRFSVLFEFGKDFEGCYFDFGVYTEEIFPISHYLWRQSKDPIRISKGKVLFELTIRGVHLNKGEYKLGIYLANTAGEVLFEAQNIIAAKVLTCPEYTGHTAVISNDADVCIEVVN